MSVAQAKTPSVLDWGIDWREMAFAPLLRHYYCRPGMLDYRRPVQLRFVRGGWSMRVYQVDFDSASLAETRVGQYRQAHVKLPVKEAQG